MGITKGKKRGTAMKYIIQIGIISGISFVAEILHELLPLPVPASVYGLLLLLFLLLTGILKEEHIRDTADFMLSIMPLFFVPASVALITSYESIKGNILKLVVMCLVSTIVVMVVTGGVSQLIVRAGKKSEKQAVVLKQDTDEEEGDDE